MLKKENRLKLKKDFNQIFKTGHSFYGRFVGVKIKKNNLNCNRFAILISKKVEKKAVNRNKLKRKIKNYIINEEKNFSNFYDCVIIVLSSFNQNQEVDVLLELEIAFKKIKK